MPAPPSGLIAAASLVAGFAVADLTGVRPLGGLVLGLGVAFCWPLWRRATGPGTAVVLALVFLAGFAAAHPLAKVVGAWPAVLLVAATVGATCWVVADRRSPTGTAPADRGR
ncbi:MAG: hypothetical protein ACRDYU_03615 [Actinomycetes bacterium]